MNRFFTGVFACCVIALGASFGADTIGAGNQAKPSRPRSLVTELKKLPAQVNLSAIERLLGRPDLKADTALAIYLYYLDDGSKVVVTALDSNEVVWVFVKYPDRNRDLLYGDPMAKLPGLEYSVPGEALSQAELAEERRDAVTLEQAMKAAGELTLLSIAPDSRSNKHAPEAEVVQMPAWGGDAWTVTGKVVLRDSADIAALASSLRENIQHNEMAVAACFRPRHAIRFRRGADEVTLLVCFECIHCDISGFKEREKQSGFHLAMEPNPSPIWNRIFRKAGLTIQVDSLRSLAYPTGDLPAKP